MNLQRIPHTLAVHSAWISHAVLVGGAVYLYVSGKISEAAMVGIVTGVGGAWAGVIGALKLSGPGQPVTHPAGGQPAPGVTVTPAETPTAPASGSD